MATAIDKPRTLSHDPELKILSWKKLHGFIHSSHFNLSSDSIPDSAAIRIIRNLGRFSLYYALFTWIALFVALVQRHKVSTIYLVSVSQVMFLYFILLRMLPHLFVLYNDITKPRQVLLACVILFVMCLVMVHELILARGESFLFVTLAATLPLVGLHAAMSKGADRFVSEEVGVVLVSCGAAADDQVENLV